MFVKAPFIPSKLFEDVVKTLQEGQKKLAAEMDKSYKETIQGLDKEFQDHVNKMKADMNFGEKPHAAAPAQPAAATKANPPAKPPAKK